MCHQTVGLAARHLEAHGIPTVIMGCAKDIVEHCGVPRFLWSDFPLGNSAGRPFDFQPVWFLSAPEQHVSAANGHAPAAHAVSGANKLALAKAEESTAGGPVGDTTGGASDRW